MKFELFKEKGKWNWRMVSISGFVLCQGTTYNGEGEARRACKAFKRTVEAAAIVSIGGTDNGSD